MAKGRIFIGVGGWTFAPWRGGFYPDTLTQKRELEYMAGELSSVEVNGTFYGSQKPETFAKWASETPKDFVFALKGPRFATNRRVLGEAGESVGRFIEGGLSELGEKLGPINWQLAGTKAFDAEDFAAFLKLLPATVSGLTLRHAVEARHESFAHPEAIAVAREHGVALITAIDGKYPTIADVTADFVYLRLMGTSADHPAGYSDAELNERHAWIAEYAKGKVPGGLDRIGPAPAPGTRDVFCYVISGAKERNPMAAKSLMERGVQ